jgi:hypothetical protein
MRLICEILKDLGLRDVTGLLDGDKAAVAQELRQHFPKYRFFTLPAADIRDKPARPESVEKSGLCSTGGELHPQFVEAFDALIDQINGADKVTSK